MAGDQAVRSAEVAVLAGARLVASAPSVAFWSTNTPS
jgi:hypothetical protein